ncbi:hypothetical protein JAAARDRAFT_605042 [Jaapia argillacea MUCL 33604]|uniref:Ubiquitin-like domain-containing protein n=1 Tax=Jaapia argillacea MUCL 33604 TaxID=933084 RepID=A0A067QA44_9AGAM|nr:hypothetical protein JAAARDRAFT_605042 [Jaapia argillacea MUCL 33604]
MSMSDPVSIVASSGSTERDPQSDPEPTSLQPPATASTQPRSAVPSIFENRRYLDGAIGTAPASARTSFTRVNEAGVTSVFDADIGTHEGFDADYEPEPAPATEPEVPQTPRTSVTFLLVTGRRRTMSFEPDTTVGRVKELIWNTWPSEAEWQDERPPAPSYLRILYLGKILQDDDTLTKLNFPATTSSPTVPATPSTIVHLSIRPHAHPSEDDFKKKGKRRRRSESGDTMEEGEATGCCGCIIC